MNGKKTLVIPAAKIPALKTALLFMGGIYIAGYADFTFPRPVYGYLFILILWASAEYFGYRYFSTRLTNFTLFFYIILITATGMLRYSIHWAGIQKEKAKIVNLRFIESGDLLAEGFVMDKRSTLSGNLSILLQVTRTEIEEAVWNHKFKIQLYADPAHFKKELMEGDEILVNARIFNESKRRNPHEFDFNKILEKQGIFVQGSIEKLLKHRRPPGAGFWSSFRLKIRKSVDQNFTYEVRPVAKALLTGYKNELTGEEKSDFARSGLSHIMAVSGLHVGFIIAPFWMIIPWFWRFKSGRIFAIAILTVILILFSGLTGFSPSVSRASLMAWLFTFSRIFQKPAYNFNLLGVAAFILLWIDPGQLYDIGFQLSFLAVSIILLIMPQIAKLTSEKFRVGFAGKLLGVITLSGIVQLGLFPVLIYYFNEFSIIGPLANVLTVPLLGIAIPAGSLMVSISAISGWTVPGAINIVEWVFIWISFVAEYTSSLPYSYITYRSDNHILLFLLWIFTIAFISMIHQARFRWKLLTGIMAILFINLAINTVEKLEPSTLKVTILDVYQGDAIHIETPEEKHLLIDAGRWSPAGNSGEKTILPYLKWKNIERLDAVIISHPHSDHIGGLPYLVQNIEIGAIYMNGKNYTSKLFADAMMNAQKKKIPILKAGTGHQIELDPSIRIYILSPEESFAFTNPNNHSVVIKVVYGENSFLFTGDAEHEQEEMIIKRFGDFLKTDFLKIGHHGSKTSSSDEFLKLTKPEHAIGSLAFRNKFGHPHHELINRIYSNRIEYSFTSLDGAIILESTGNSIKRISWK